MKVFLISFGSFLVGACLVGDTPWGVWKAGDAWRISVGVSGFIIATIGTLMP